MRQVWLTILCLLTFVSTALAQSGIVQPVQIRLDAACIWDSGTGSPEGVRSGATCDVWYRTDGTAGATIYVKNGGTRGTPTTTGWTPLPSTASGAIPVTQGGTGLTALPADNEFLLSNGSVYQPKAIPDCNDTTEKLDYNGTTNALSCIADQVASGAGSGDFVGPASSTDNAYLRFDGATGKLGQNGVITESDTGQWTLPDDIRQTFNPGATNAGFNVGAIAGDPSTPVNGDVWYDSTANELTARINGTSVALGAGGGSSGDTVVMKASDETVNNSSTLQNDDALLFALEADKTYWFELYAVANASSANADLLVGFSGPAGVTVYWGPEFQSTSLMYWSASATGSGQQNLKGIASTMNVGAPSSGTHGVHLVGIIVNGANTGNFTFRWAQLVATVENSSIKAGSFMRYRKLN